MVCASARVPYALFGKDVVRQRVLMDRLAGFGYGGWATRDTAEEATRMVKLMPVIAGFSLRRRYLWSVLMGEAENEPRARFVTDPVGVREVFRLRDISPGKRRRAALLHWVRANWRQRRPPCSGTPRSRGLLRFTTLTNIRLSADRRLKRGPPL
jgi:hypothetical protein